MYLLDIAEFDETIKRSSDNSGHSLILFIVGTCDYYIHEILQLWLDIHLNIIIFRRFLKF
jgi:hypothetical protein